MSSPGVNFVSGPTENSRDSSEQGTLSLCYAYPVIDNDRDSSGVLSSDKRATARATSNNGGSSREDGLYVSENPFTDKIVKPYRLDNAGPLDYESRPRFRGKLVEIAIRDVRVRAPSGESATTIEITSVSILFERRPICRTCVPFNRQLNKLLIRDTDRHNLAIQVHARHGQSSLLPLPLPGRCVRDKKTEIDFAIDDDTGGIYPGTVVCTVSLSVYGDAGEQRRERDGYTYGASSNADPNDPQNGLALSRPERPAGKRDVKYFLLQDPALTFDTAIDTVRGTRTPVSEPPDVVVNEQRAFSLLDVSFGSLFQASRPLRPTSGARRHHAIGRTVLSVTVLRAVEIPVREESASVSPLVETEWGNVVRATTVADGPAPVWQQTVHFELSRRNGDRSCVKLRLYDQHPVWGKQWLGEARIPLEDHRNYQELERWVALSPLFSPVLLFGYVQASPGQSCTRIYVLMKLEQPCGGNAGETGTVDNLSKGVQRCLATPYSVTGVDTPDEAARLAMLLPSLPVHYGPVTPRQALNVNKVDHYGRAALLATLLQGFGTRSYVLLGSSQISRRAAFVLSVEDDDVLLWDPEIGERYKLSDSRCSLTRVSRLINHTGIWENLQRSVLLHNLRYNVAISKDWRAIGPVAASTSNRSVQTLELAVTGEGDARDRDNTAEMEQYLRDKLSASRGALGSTTVFNRHAVTVLRAFVSNIPNGVQHQFDRRELTQLYRAYHAHGFLLSLRQATPDELAEQIAATKVHDITGPIEFALVCHVQRCVGKTCSIWLALAILRSRG